MVIDIEPIVTPASDTIKIAMEMNGETERYVVRLANGNDYSITFTVKGLEEFLPNRTVGEMLVAWEEGLQREYDRAVNVVLTGIHPEWKSRAENPNWKPFEPKTIEVPYTLNKQQIKSWAYHAERKKLQLGKLTFHKLVL